MRVALVAETFLPNTNGVVNSVLRVADELAAFGHTPVVIAPAGAPSHISTRTGVTVEVHGVPSVSLPFYRGLLVARPGLDLTKMLADVGPDVVHLASPLLLGGSAAYAAHQLGLPIVAVFQTDVSGFLRRYHLGAAVPAVWERLRRIHALADLTLAPSSASAYQLCANGIERVSIWSRGVDGARFSPRHRCATMRRQLLGSNELLVGAIGRLAPEKRLDLLDVVSGLPGVQLVVVGDGPQRRRLERAMPDARFTGLKTGIHLSRLMASIDLLVNPGADETFCQVVQEALSSGVPVIAAASGGPLDLVRHRDNGWLWAGDDPHVLAAMVAARRDDRAELAAVARRARPSVAGRSWAQLTADLLSHYESVLGGDVLLREDQLREPLLDEPQLVGAGLRQRFGVGTGVGQSPSGFQAERAQRPGHGAVQIQDAVQVKDTVQIEHHNPLKVG